MSITPIAANTPAPATQTQSPPAAPSRGDHDGDADDKAGAARSSPQKHVGGLVDRDA
ncbi:MAG TPA: hypothetical protein VG943_13035 [Caulobacterales bacterium]|nr:hypothetical protein [Caulobacterales bacterium]